MAIFALADLHLGLARNKSMERFGPLWQDHTTKIAAAWKATVAAEDTVLLPGDLSWAMRWEEFIPDLEFIAALPGTKIISRGNHDFYWSSKSKMQRLLPNGVIAIEQSAAMAEGYMVVGIKGWLTPGAAIYDAANDEKFYLRERGRLQRALQEAVQYDLPLIVQMHFPPWADAGDIGFSDLLENFSVKICVYGHLHGGNWTRQSGGLLRGVRYQLTSADYLNFTPIRLL